MIVKARPYWVLSFAITQVHLEFVTNPPCGVVIFIGVVRAMMKFEPKRESYCGSVVLIT